MATRRPPTKYAVPDGFETLLEGLAKEVLRSQPENIYQFASDYFDSLLRMRESTQTDKLETLVSLYDPSRRSQPCDRTIQSATSSYQSEVTYHSEVEVTTDDEGNDRHVSLTNGSIRQQDDADPVTATGGHVTSINGENEAASKIQAGYRGYKTRRCVEKKRINEGRAAVKIQAGYRGHKTRRAITEKRREEKMAAVTIQSNYRGYRERKQHSTKRSTGSKKISRPTKYSDDIVSISSDGSLVEYADLEVTDLRARPSYGGGQEGIASGSGRGLAGSFEWSPVNSDIEDGKPESRRPDIDTALTGASDVEGDVILYRQSSDEEGGDDDAQLTASFVSSETVDSESTITGGEIDYHDAQRAAARIQAGYRGMLVRRESKMQIEMKARTENQAATKIQSTYRGYRGRKQKTPEHQDVRDESTGKEAAATIIQAGYRGMVGRRQVKQQLDAATTIQSGYRGFRTRKVLERESEAANTIQASFRGYITRKEILTEKLSATRIQSRYRGYRKRRDFKKQQESATKIQASFRGYRVRRNRKDPSN